MSGARPAGHWRLTVTLTSIAYSVQSTHSPTGSASRPASQRSHGAGKVNTRLTGSHSHWNWLARGGRGLPIYSRCPLLWPWP